jgi:predicted nucleic acid-binding Zn ribbon protein
MPGRRDRRGPQPVSRILVEALRASGLAERLEERAPLLGWAEIAGEEMAHHTWAVDLQDGVLVLEADHGAWRQEVTMLVPEIIDKYNARFGAGTVTEIRWRERAGRTRRAGRKP